MLVNTPAPYTDRHVGFEAWLEHASRNFPAGVLGMADYARTIEIYDSLFGAERIAILLLEDWKADAGAFADRLSTILGVDAPTTRQLLGDRRTHGQETDRQVRYDRLAKRFPLAGRVASHLPGKVRGLARGFLRRGATQRIALPPGWTERLRDLYRSGNRHLVERYGLPLREHDYAV